MESPHLYHKYNRYTSAVDRLLVDKSKITKFLFVVCNEFEKFSICNNEDARNGVFLGRNSVLLQANGRNRDVSGHKSKESGQ